MHLIKFNTPSQLKKKRKSSKLGLKGNFLIVIKDVYKAPTAALAGVALWTECQPMNQKIACLIPSQGTCLGCRPGP